MVCGSVQPGYKKCVFRFYDNSFSRASSEYGAILAHLRRHYTHFFIRKSVVVFEATIVAQTKQELEVDERAFGLISSDIWPCSMLSEFVPCDTRSGIMAEYYEYERRGWLTVKSGFFKLSSRPWIEDAPNHKFHYTAVPPLNFITVSFQATGSAREPGYAYYGVIKNTSHDFWILREGSCFIVHNAAVFGRQLPAFLAYFSQYNEPPSTCEFLTLSVVPNDFATSEHFKFNVDPRQRAPQLMNAASCIPGIEVLSATCPISATDILDELRRRLVNANVLDAKL